MNLFNSITNYYECAFHLGRAGRDGERGIAGATGLKGEPGSLGLQGLPGEKGENLSSFACNST